MFRGRFKHTIDAKGRLSIPAKFRDVLKEEPRLVVTTFFGGCLRAYPHEEWRILEEKIEGLSEFNKDAAEFLRRFYSPGRDCHIDRLGRILIPQPLREYARLEKDVVIIGIFKRFEIWDKALWDAYEAAASKEDIVGTLGSLGL